MRLLGLGCSCDNTDSKLAVHITLHCGSLRRYLRDVICVVVEGGDEGGGQESDRLKKLPVSEYEQ